LIDDEYADRGVRFDSAGRGLCRAAPSNPVSAPNVVTATSPGPVISYSDPVTATFSFGDRPAVVDYVQLTLTSGSSATLIALDITGAIVGTAAGGSSAILRVDAAGAIHKVIVEQGPMGFDDFLFDGLAPVGGLTLAATEAADGRMSDLSVHGAPANDVVVLLWGHEPSVATSRALAVSAPSVTTAVRTDGSGTAQMSVAVPALADGIRLLLQVVAPSVGSSSNMVWVQHRGPGISPPALAPAPSRDVTLRRGSVPESSRLTPTR
jgi:hypothetical protein